MVGEDMPIENAKLDGNGGTFPDNDNDTVVSVNTGTSASDFPVPVRNGYIFVGWNTNMEATVGDKSIITASKITTYYAIWKEPNVQINGTSHYIETVNLCNSCTFSLLPEDPFQNVTYVQTYNSDEMDLTLNNLPNGTRVRFGTDDIKIYRGYKNVVNGSTVGLYYYTNTGDEPRFLLLLGNYYGFYKLGDAGKLTKMSATDMF